MALLTQLLGNRELAWEDQLEKGRVWLYGDGNQFTPMCNGFCWKPPGYGKVIIELWGPGGSSGKGCCCGGGLPGNPGAYVRKCICVCPSNYICSSQGSVGRACGGANADFTRGDDQESVQVCWTGCAPNALFQGGLNTRVSYNSWKGNNPWGVGNGETLGNIPSVDTNGRNWSPRGSNAVATVCCAAGASCGCLCAQSGQAGTFYCSNASRTTFWCFWANRYCGQTIGGGDSPGDFPNYVCGIICNAGSECGNWQMRGIRCGFGGDMNCCGTFSCLRMLDCVRNNNNCRWMYHHNTPAMQYTTEGGVVTYVTDHDTPASPYSGGAAFSMNNAYTSLSRQPSHGVHKSCWNGGRSCGCYESFGCVTWSPAGNGGYPSQSCGDVRDHGGRGGNGTVRIRYVPDVTDVATLVGATISGANPGVLTFTSSTGVPVRQRMVLSGGGVTAGTVIVAGSGLTWTLNQAATGTPTTATGGTY